MSCLCSNRLNHASVVDAIVAVVAELPFTLAAFGLQRDIHFE